MINLWKNCRESMQHKLVTLVNIDQVITKLNIEIITKLKGMKKDLLELWC